MSKLYKKTIVTIVPFVKGGLVGIIIVLIVFVLMNIVGKRSGTTALLPCFPYISCMLIYSVGYIYCMSQLSNLTYKLKCITDMGILRTDPEISHNDEQFLDK